MRRQQTVFDTYADLRSDGAPDGMMAFVLGKTTAGDSFIRYFIYDVTSTATDNDDTVVRPTGFSRGAWLQSMTPSRSAAINSAKTYNIGGLIIHTDTGTVAGGNGEVTYNLTTDGTAGGTAIFNTILFTACTAIINTTSAVAKGTMNEKSRGASNKTITFTGATGTTLLALGATAVQIPNGTVCTALVIGF